MLQVWSLLNFSCTQKKIKKLFKSSTLFKICAINSIFPLRTFECPQSDIKNMLTIQNSFQVTWCYIFSPPLLTSSGIPRFWMNPCQTGLIRSHHRQPPPPPVPLPAETLSHSSQRSPPHPFWALRISCAKLLICLVTSQCFLHGTEGKISTLLRAVNHSTLPLVHWYDHYSIRLHSNWPHFLSNYSQRLGECFPLFSFS